MPQEPPRIQIRIRKRRGRSNPRETERRLKGIAEAFDGILQMGVARELAEVMQGIPEQYRYDHTPNEV